MCKYKSKFFFAINTVQKRCTILDFIIFVCNVSKFFVVYLKQKNVYTQVGVQRVVTFNGLPISIRKHAFLVNFLGRLRENSYEMV
jgi:hypothetical protein